MDRLKRLEFVNNQLGSYPSSRKVLGSTFVSCPFHTEKTPSCRIFHSPQTINPGYFKCYGCGQSGKWDTIAPKLGLRPFEWTKPTPLWASSVVTTQDYGSEPSSSYDSTPLPKDKLWRGIETNLLISIGCKIIREYGTKFVYMPVMIRNEERGYIRARLRKEAGKPSYLNKAGKWSENYGLFPYDHVTRSNPNTIVLVEGPRDALTLISKNIPAIAILGTQSWSKIKSRNLELSGASNIIVMMDGDAAGIKASAMIVPTLKNLFKKVLVFDLSGDDSPYCKYSTAESPSKAAALDGVELWDPGNCPPHKIRQLKTLIRKLN